jgi:hypothetical protein
LVEDHRPEGTATIPVEAESDGAVVVQDIRDLATPDETGKYQVKAP